MSEAVTGSEFVITRVLGAPRQMVFQAWTEAEHLGRWWGPKGFSISLIKLDLRPGGLFRYSMRPPDGNEMWGKFVYREIVPPERIVFVNAFSDPEGNTVRPPFAPNFPLEVLNTLTLTEQDSQTVLTLRGLPVNATAAEHQVFAAMHDSMQQGWTGTLDQLAAELTLQQQWAPMETSPSS